MSDSLTPEADALVQQGDFAGGLGALARYLAQPNVAPQILLMAYGLEVRLQRYEDADRTMKRLLGAAPQIAQAMDVLARNARADHMLAARLADRTLAGKRSGIGMPPPHALAYIRAAVAHASGDFAGALAALVEGDRASPRLAGTLHWRNGRTAPFTNIVDSDDLTGPILPVMDGDAVLDIAYSELASVTFGDPRMSFDALWMPAEIHPHAGRPFQAKVPAMYPNSGVSHEPHVRMGNETVWGRSTGYAVAVGQRDFKMFDGAGGMSMTGIMQIRAIAFSVTTSPASTR